MGLEGMVQGKGNPKLEEWDCKGGEKVGGRSDWSGGATDSGRNCVAFGEDRGGSKAGLKKAVIDKEGGDGRRTRLWCIIPKG